MKPSRLSSEDVEGYVASGLWSRKTMVEAYQSYARELPEKTACGDEQETYTWQQLKTASDRLAANLIGLGLERDARVLVQIPSSSREFLLRIALKKAGLIGAFVPMQWRQREIGYVLEHLDPTLIVLPRAFKEFNGESLLADLSGRAAGVRHRIDISGDAPQGWLAWESMIGSEPSPDHIAAISNRRFRFDEVSLVTTSSGTSGLAKLCEWPEGAQLCIGHGIGERMRITPEDHIGVFSPMAGAAGTLLWTVSAATPCRYTFPENYDAAFLLDLVQRERLTVITTVPVVLARLAQQPLENYDLSSLRALRVGTAAMDRNAANSFETRTGCRVIPASGSMECPGFGHAGVDEPRELRLSGSVGRPLRGCRLRIQDNDGDVPVGSIGEVKVTAAFASSGYWRDPELTASVWSDGWYSTGDLGHLDADDRLTLMGRMKEVINRSGHKILPTEIERIICQHPDVFECAVVAAPDREYGEVPWAFIQPRPGQPLEIDSIIAMLRDTGLASYKIPSRIIEVTTFPRVGENKIDKKSLLRMTI